MPLDKSKIVIYRTRDEIITANCKRSLSFLLKMNTRKGKINNKWVTDLGPDMIIKACVNLTSILALIHFTPKLPLTKYWGAVYFHQHSISTHGTVQAIETPLNESL